MKGRLQAVKNSVYGFLKDNSFFRISWRRWYIGITQNPETAKEIHNFPSIWMDWHVRTDDIARELVKYFRNKHSIKGGFIKEENWPYIYVYKIRPYTEE